jgi:hypothetical protein
VFENACSAENLVGVTHQELEQGILPGRKVDRFRSSCDGASGGIESDVADYDGCRTGGCPPTNKGAKPGQ